MERLKTNKRKIYRKITAISAIPLLVTIVSGTIYSILQPLGIDSFWLIKWHTGCLLYTSPSPRDISRSRIPSYA